MDAHSGWRPSASNRLTSSPGISRVRQHLGCIPFPQKQRPRVWLGLDRQDRLLQMPRILTVARMRRRMTRPDPSASRTETNQQYALLHTVKHAYAKTGLLLITWQIIDLNPCCTSPCMQAMTLAQHVPSTSCGHTLRATGAPQPSSLGFTPRKTPCGNSTRIPAKQDHLPYGPGQPNWVPACAPPRCAARRLTTPRSARSRRARSGCPRCRGRRSRGCRAAPL